MTQDGIDQPRPVRSGEELDTTKLEDYLRSRLPSLQGSLAVAQFPSGFSNLTYLLRADDQELILRRPPFGARIKSGHDMSREYRILSHLTGTYQQVPRPLLYCDDESVIGAPFYVMERVKGVILRAKPPQEITLISDTMRRLSEAFVDNLAALHTIDYQAAGLGELGHAEGYVKRQVEGWIRRYENARTDEIAEMDRVAGWMTEHMPPECGVALIHNDYKYDNLVLDPADLTHIIAVLDWEMATLGDPLMDLGTTLGYWIDPDDAPELKGMAFCLTTLPGNLNRRELVDRYAEKSGRTVEHALFYYVYGLYKIAVIVQQIYFRYKQGLTRDERFATLIMGVHVLSQTATKAIDKGRIDGLN